MYEYTNESRPYTETRDYSIMQDFTYNGVAMPNKHLQRATIGLTDDERQAIDAEIMLETWAKIWPYKKIMPEQRQRLIAHYQKNRSNGGPSLIQIRQIICALYGMPQYDPDAVKLTAPNTDDIPF